MGFDLPVMNRLRRSGRALSPASLFSTGAQGVIYDPRDLTTMFQDSAGTTPVTAPGQLVGLRLDKSKGGPGPELAPNGSFDNPVTTGWTAQSSATLSVVSGELNINTATGANFPGGLYAFTTVVGRTYRVSLTARRTATFSACRVYVSDSGGNFITDLPVIGTTTTTYNFVFVARQVSTTVAIFEFTSSSGTGTIFVDNVSIKELPGNHATQATSGARLTYGIEPKTGTRNLFTYTEQFNNPIWAGSPVITPDAIAAPDGSMTADLVTSGGMFRSFGPTLGISYTASVYAKPYGAASTMRLQSGSGFSPRGTTTFNLTAGTVSSGPGVITPIGDGWYRLSVQLTYATAADANVYWDTFGTGAYIWGAQAEVGPVATPYQKVVTAFEVTEAGVPTCHYCAYAGANSMATAAIDFTATDKMSVFAGVRKLSDATTAALIEFSTNIAINTGSFLVTAPNTTGASGDYGFYSRGSVTIGSSAKSAANPAPITSVISAFGDISIDERKIRVNGTGEVVDASDQGTGNYGNYSLYIGRRADSTLPFTGRDYGIVIVGKAASAAEINITEAWLAANTPTVVL
jgi:hypothetical protein